MSNIEFNQEYIPSRNLGGNDSKPSFLVHFLMKLKLAKNPQVANYILVAVATAAFTLSIVIFFNVFTKPDMHTVYYQPPISKDFARTFVRNEFPTIPNEVFNRLPDYFYREDIPSDIIKLLPADFINLIPQEPRQ